MRAERYPRDLALRVLARVFSESEALDRALDAVAGEAPTHRAWLQEVCSGTVRWRSRLEMAIDAAAIKKKPSGWLRRALLLASYQLIAQDHVSNAAVVSEAVDQIKRKEGEAPARFANAVLRKVSDHAASWRSLEFPGGAPPDQQAQWASLPVWLWKRIVTDRGLDWARAFALASLDRPRLWVSSRDADWTLPWLEPGPIPGSFRVQDEGAGSRITDWPGFEEGRFIVQDISSQRLVQEISDRVRQASGPEIRAIDWCAAPGGKSAGLSWAGMSVVAHEIDERRVPLLLQTIRRVAENVRIVDERELAELEPAELVWVDAPCTGSGILRRHPDVRWLKQEGDLAQLNRLQDEILARAWEKVKPGGFLAYSVCSVLKVEGEQRVAPYRSRGRLEGEWLFAPQEPPFGDGFYGALVRRDQR